MKIKPLFINKDGILKDGYFDHVSRYKGLLESSVYNIFNSELISESNIEKLKLDIFNRVLQFTLSVPNFRLKNNVYVSVDFRLTFKKVYSLFLESSDNNDLNDGCLTYINSEFNTLNIMDDSRLIKYNDDIFNDSKSGTCELLLSCMKGNDEFLMAVSFCEFESKAVNLVDYELVLMNSNMERFNLTHR